jgi:hypothetical protein
MVSVQLDDQTGPGPVTGDKIGGAVRIDVEIRMRRVGGDFVQILDQPPFRRAVEIIDADLERFAEAQQESAAHLPLVVLDQVQIGRRDADRGRKFRLRAAETFAPVAQSHSDRRTGHFQPLDLV